MPETPGSPFCPVQSFEFYVSKLQPKLGSDPLVPLLITWQFGIPKYKLVQKR